MSKICFFLYLTTEVEENAINNKQSDFLLDKKLKLRDKLLQLFRRQLPRRYHFNFYYCYICNFITLLLYYFHFFLKKYVQSEQFELKTSFSFYNVSNKDTGRCQ